MLTLIIYKNINYGIIALYRSPSGNLIKFIEELYTIIANIIKSHKNVLDNTNSTVAYLDLLNSLKFLQLVNRPPDLRPIGTCIDHIFIKDNHNYYNL